MANMIFDKDTYETLGPHKQHEGRRHVPINQKNTFDFLKGGQGPEQHVGRSCERSTKYHNGFNRRQRDCINPEQTRLEHENTMAARHAARGDAREDYLTQQGCRYGNVILRTDGEQMPSRNRKHYARGEEPSQRRRRQNGGARYFTEDTADNTQRRMARMENVTNRQQQTSSVLGVGRQDLSSKGTWDNFSGTPVGLLQPLSSARLSERPF